MYFDYLLEREDKQSIVLPGKGFIVYKIQGQECYVCECYVVPHHRRERIAWDMMDKIVDIAHENNCNILTATVIPSLKGASESMAAQLAYGFEIKSAHPDCIVMAKEI